MPEFTQAEPNLWQWGDWFIAFAYDRFWLLVSSGVEYGPFQYFDTALQHAQDIAA